MDNNKTNDIKRKVLRRAMIIAAVILSVSIVATIGVAVFYNFIAFPRIDKALANSLEEKLDIGTRFDITDLFEKGKIELLSDTANGKDTLNAAVSYNGNGMAGSIDLGESHFGGVLTEEGIAASLSTVENGKRYGAYFEDITATLDASFLNPKNKAENALERKEYQKLLSLARKLEDKANSDKQEKKDATVVLVEIAKVFNDSSLSDRETSFDGITINGEKRKARTLTYAFDKVDLIDFLEKLEALFDSPSDKLRDAMERLLEKESLTRDIENMGYSLDTCEDLASFIGSIKRLVNRIDRIAIKIEIAYVANAISAIVVEGEIGDTTSIELLIDLGAKPKKDKTIYATLLVEETHSSSQSQYRYVFDYSVQRVEKVNSVSAIYSSSVIIKDGDLEEKNSSEYSFEMLIDKKNDSAKFSFDNSSDEFLNGKQTASSENFYSVSCDMEDRASKLSLVLLSVAVGSNTTYVPDEKITLTFYKKPDSIDLGEFTELLKMNITESDRIASSAVTEFERIWNAIKDRAIVFKESESQ